MKKLIMIAVVAILASFVNVACDQQGDTKSNNNYVYKDQDNSNSPSAPNSPCNPDNDNDGFSSSQGDCDDNDPVINPVAREILCDGIDQNCNGLIDDDQDADGDGVNVCAGDCDDNNPDIYPGAAEVLCDGIDQNCNGLIDDDQDADGDGISICQGDCDDKDPANICAFQNGATFLITAETSRYGQEAMIDIHKIEPGTPRIVHDSFLLQESLSLELAPGYYSVRIYQDYDPNNPETYTSFNGGTSFEVSEGEMTNVVVMVHEINLVDLYLNLTPGMTCGIKMSGPDTEVWQFSALHNWDQKLTITYLRVLFKLSSTNVDLGDAHWKLQTDLGWEEIATQFYRDYDYVDTYEYYFHLDPGIELLPADELVFQITLDVDSGPAGEGVTTQISSITPITDDPYTWTLIHGLQETCSIKF